MSKHNYSQYSNKNQNKPNNNNQKPKSEPITATPEVKVVNETPQVVMPKPRLVQETVETVSLPDTVKGVVINCARLNVRENATTDSGIVCVLNATSEIKVDVNKSNNKWVYVYTATGAEGYCMREYIDARL